MVVSLEKQMLNKDLISDKDFPLVPGENSCNPGNCFTLLRTRFKEDVKRDSGKGEVFMNADFVSCSCCSFQYFKSSKAF